MNFLERLKHRQTILRHVLIRRWYIVVAVMLCMVPILYDATNSTGVYYSRVEVMFLPPPSKVGGNALKSEAVTTVMYAAIVERGFNGNVGGQRLKTTDAPLYATGLRNGHSVFLPNSGGQWQMNFDDPEIIVEVVSESRETVVAEMQRIVDRLQQSAHVQQQSIGVLPEAYITTELSPSEPGVMYVGIRKSRELAALLGLTVALAVGLPLFGDRLLSGISRRRAGKKGSAKPVVPADEVDREISANAILATGSIRGI